MVALTAEVQPGTWSVQLVATGTVGVVAFYRTRAGTDTYLGSATGDPAVVVDYGPDLNVAHDYYATDDEDTDVVAGVTVTAGAPVLSSVTSPLARAVTVVSYRPYTFEGRSTVHHVLGRADPLVMIHPMAYPSGELVLLAAGNTERVQLQDLMKQGETMLLRTTCPDRLDTFYFQPMVMSDPFLNEDRRDGPSYLRVEFQATDYPAGILPPDATRNYQSVLDAHGTYQDVLLTWGTYRQLLDG